MKRLLVAALFAATILLAAAETVTATDPQVGTASWYGPGNSVATQWCTWVLRHQQGCGILAIKSLQTGRIVYAPVSDWCQCYRGTPRERIVDLQLGVVSALGLSPSQGLYPVQTWRVEQDIGTAAVGLPDTALSQSEHSVLIGILLIGFAALLLADYYWRTRR